MKTRIDKEFFEKWKNEKVVMWCKKKEYAEEFCRLMNEQGLTWYQGKSYLNEKTWHVHKEKTVYEFNNGNYCSKGHYENKGNTILNFEDYIVKEKMTKQELVKLMVENFTDECRVLDLSGLDFSEYECDISISCMKAPQALYQDCQEVQGNLYQNGHNVQGDLYQEYQEVQGNLFQEQVEDYIVHDQKSRNGNV